MKQKNKNKKNNIWKISAAILGVIVVILFVIFITLFVSNITVTGNAVLEESSEIISGDEAGEQVTEFLNQQTGGGVEYISSNNKSDLYEITVSYQGQEIPVYITKDGKYFIKSLVPISGGWPSVEESNTQSVEVTKTEKPRVELFIMSHCPYGTQIEKGIIPVVKELGDKIDFEMKFVNYAMHPIQGEVEEQLNQYCIQKEFNDKYLIYLGKFLEAGNSADAFKIAGITESDIASCVKATDEQYDVMKNLEDKSSWSSGQFPKFMIHDADNRKYGVQGSPTLIINGAEAQSGRDAQSLLNTICSAFLDKLEECNTDMSSFGNPGPGFGFETQGGSATAAGCGV